MVGSKSICFLTALNSVVFLSPGDRPPAFNPSTGDGRRYNAGGVQLPRKLVQVLVLYHFDEIGRTLSKGFRGCTRHCAYNICGYPQGSRSLKTTPNLDSTRTHLWSHDRLGSRPGKGVACESFGCSSYRRINDTYLQ